MLDNPDGCIDAALDAGVRMMISVGIDLKSSSAAVEYADSNEAVLAAVGIHPHDAGSLDTSTIEQLEKLAASSQVVAIGETGLDYYRDRSPRDAQQGAFISQIELAKSLGKTLIVHSREAGEDTLRILRRHAGDLIVVLHCFALVDSVAECASSGYYMSLAGNVTYKNAGELHKAAVEIPEELLLTETDAPFLTPVPHRGEPNQPAHVRHILRTIAAIRKVDEAVLAQRLYDNFQRAFPRN